MKTISPKIRNYLVLPSGIALASYISFGITEYYGSYVQEILGLSVIYLVYRYYFSPININSYQKVDGYQNQLNIWKIFELFFLGIEFSIALQVVINMLIKLMRML